MKAKANYDNGAGVSKYRKPYKQYILNTVKKKRFIISQVNIPTIQSYLKNKLSSKFENIIK